MKYIVIDLEMNPISTKYKQEHHICSQEIIQIGAVLLDEKFQEISSFTTLVKPQFNNRIWKNYEKLTGITTSMVKSAPCFEEALKAFGSWYSHIHDQVQFIQWSTSDQTQMKREIQLKKIQLDSPELSFINEKWADLQAEYVNTLGMDRSISLSDAVMFAGEDFKGHAHDALIDARNTAYVLSVLRDEKKCEKTLHSVIDVFKPKTNCLLGDLFDFSSLCLQL